MNLGKTSSGICPFADSPDMTGSGCVCSLPPPMGFWRFMAWLLDPSSDVCVSGQDCCGDGRLPCNRLRRRRIQEYKEIRRMRDNG